MNCIVVSIIVIVVLEAFMQAFLVQFLISTACRWWKVLTTPTLGSLIITSQSLLSSERVALGLEELWEETIWAGGGAPTTACAYDWILLDSRRD
jgi:putative Ca2+/H+ antiporter (TMEM165/GDT1 family)